MKSLFAWTHPIHIFDTTKNKQNFRKIIVDTIKLSTYWNENTSFDNNISIVCDDYSCIEIDGEDENLEDLKNLFVSTHPQFIK